MNVAMACNESWYYYLVVNLYSLLENTKNVKKVYLLLETDKVEDVPMLGKILEKYSSVKLELINFNNIIDELVDKGNVNRDTIYSNFCFARLALPSLVKEEKILYIDTDAIVLKDISNLWKYDISDYYLAGVMDIGAYNNGTCQRLSITGKYVNSGFILLNLNKIREDKIQDKWFEVINDNKLMYPDQDAINLICQHHELYLPSIYNFAVGSTREVLSFEKIKVFHYTGPKTDWVVNHLFSELWYDVEEKFKDEFGV